MDKVESREVGMCLVRGVEDVQGGFDGIVEAKRQMRRLSGMSKTEIFPEELAKY